MDTKILVLLERRLGELEECWCRRTVAILKRHIYIKEMLNGFKDNERDNAEGVDDETSQLYETE